MQPRVPKGHKHLTFEDTGRFSTDPDGNLCLDGKPIEVKKMTLTKWQTFVVSLAAFSTFGLFLLQILDRLL